MGCHDARAHPKQVSGRVPRSLISAKAVGSGHEGSSLAYASCLSISPPIRCAIVSTYAKRQWSSPSKHRLPDSYMPNGQNKAVIAVVFHEPLKSSAKLLKLMPPRPLPREDRHRRGGRRLLARQRARGAPLALGDTSALALRLRTCGRTDIGGLPTFYDIVQSNSVLSACTFDQMYSDQPLLVAK